jgi:YHS domain-containing protein
MGRLLSYFVELIFLIVISKMLGRALQGLFGPSPPRRENHAAGGGPRDSARMRTGKTERDPVCGMFVSTELSHRLVRGSETLHFCSHECLERYQDHRDSKGSP